MSSTSPSSPSPSAEFTPDLNHLIAQDPVNCIEIERLLDSMTHRQRVASTRAITRANQRRLFHAVDGFRPITVDAFVSAKQAPLEVVGHVGTNNLPLHRKFEKAMYRQSDGVVAGRNVQSLAALTGPGYFTLEPGRHRTSEVVINYIDLPKEKPPGWPEITDNARGISYFVYRGLHDIMRGVSKHVTIGRASRFSKELPNYFILVRPD